MSKNRKIMQMKKEQTIKGSVLDAYSNQGIVLVVSGPSGTGKGTILSKFREENKDVMFSISATTREPRASELDGVHYFFKTKDQFEHMIGNGQLLEWVNYCGNYYGTPCDYVNDNISKGKDIILELEVDGAMSIKKNLPESVLVFVMPPSYDELKMRISNRGSETRESIDKRMHSALNEISRAKYYDYVIVNDQLNQAIENLNAVLIAEKIRVKRKKSLLDSILMEGLNYER
jgi:guanylate kinase